MPLNRQQQQIVDALDGSVNVVAGAGTGKTFTLTRRIVACVERALALDSNDADPTSHVLAITFTKKAAAELKSRVRQAFLEESACGGERGEAYLRCALRIDNAWVSTIHGMASRILRENALEFGIDPSFETLSEQGASAVFSEALQRAVDEVMQSDDGELRAFLEGCDVESDVRPAGTVAAMVKKVFDVTGFMPHGLDGIVTRRSVVPWREACQPFLDQASLVRRLFELEGWPDGEAAKLVDLAQQMDAALSALGDWLDRHDARRSPDAEGSFDQEGLERAVYAFPATTPKFGKKSDHYDDMLRYRLEYKLLSERIAMRSASADAASLVRFAQVVRRHMDAIKSAGHTMFTEGDLLVACNEKLSDPANASIVERYRRQFHCIMLDEFQDTDPLQMAIVSKLAAPSGEAQGVPLANVCTVGDMQQSIYRFRGGDVEETQKRIASLKEGRGMQFELSGNYRSHKDVLDAVEAVFSRSGAFGDEVGGVPRRGCGRRAGHLRRHAARRVPVRAWQARHQVRAWGGLGGRARRRRRRNRAAFQGPCRQGRPSVGHGAVAWAHETCRRLRAGAARRGLRVRGNGRLGLCRHPPGAPRRHAAALRGEPPRRGAAARNPHVAAVPGVRRRPARPFPASWR